NFLLIFTVPLAIATFILGEKIMVFLAGDEFIVAGQILRLLIIATIAIYFKALFGYTIAAANLQKKMIKFYLIDSIITLTLYFIFIPFYGFWAAAILTIFSEIFILIFAYYLIRKNLDLKPKFALLKPVLIATLVMAGAIAFSYQQNIIIIAVFGFLVYLSVLFLLLGASWKKVLPNLEKYV
ncbi:MAG: polysaccharide biosynthesis C-terminal domain-containing protein, partial [Patescibacteria group bacterium]